MPPLAHLLARPAGFLLVSIGFLSSFYFIRPLCFSQLPLSEESKALYCHIQKAACTTWKLLLQMLLLARAWVAERAAEGLSLGALETEGAEGRREFEALFNRTKLLETVHDRHKSGLRLVCSNHVRACVFDLMGAWE